MTAEECLNQVNDKLIEIYRINTQKLWLTFGREGGCYFDMNICCKSWFGGAVRKVTPKILLDFMSSVFSETSSSNTFSFQGKLLGFFPNCLLCSLCQENKLFFPILL